MKSFVSVTKLKGIIGLVGKTTESGLGGSEQRKPTRFLEKSDDSFCRAPLKERVHSEMKISPNLKIISLIWPIVFISFRRVFQAGRKGYGKIFMCTSGPASHHPDLHHTIRTCITPSEDLQHII